MLLFAACLSWRVLFAEASEPHVFVAGAAAHGLDRYRYKAAGGFVRPRRLEDGIELPARLYYSDTARGPGLAASRRVRGPVRPR